MKKLLLTLCLLIPLSLLAFQPLTADQAFSFSIQPVDNHSMTANFSIAPGYHLYRDRFTFSVISPTDRQLVNIALPVGIAKQDDILGKYQIYEGSAAIPLTLSASAKQVVLQVGYQGCADSGFCYPPVTKQVTVKLPATAPVSNISAATNNQSCPTPALTQQDKISDFLAHSSWFLIAIGFLGFGILLAFTPCVLPMIPILSSIIVGQGEEINTIKAFWLSLIYVLAMAITYAIAGVVAGLAGGYVQAFLQSPWVLGAFSIVFVLLSLSLFGLYELQLPSRFHHHVTHLSNQQTGGTYVGVAIMGCLSTLIVSPCVTAPLIGALSYIGKTGNAVLGGSALFSMGLGMGIPLVIIGTAGGKFLPKAGLWMNTVKAFFGVLMLGVAILLLSRIISPTTTMLLWAALLIISSIYMGAFTQTPATGIGKLWKGLSLIMLVYGFLLLIGAGMGNTNPFQPLVVQRAIPVVNTPQTEPFKIITSLEELQEAIDSAKAQDKPIVLDFYADWCLSCKEMDNTTFEDPRVQVLLSRFVVLRADVTSNDDANKALEHQFNVIAPPTILFFDQNGQELNKDRIVGAVDAATLLKQLKSIIGKQ